MKQSSISTPFVASTSTRRDLTPARAAASSFRRTVMPDAGLHADRERPP
ncbi:MAG: hypothetical protein R3174_02400 [Gammaproteobacteria bacterium]|nr:hypothetical protein [Gammaproteobacteria bacterium]